ncbi:MAG: Gfo/Idh/MocA family oxidoreductase, partial [Planctomycetes bacterium]|nr:Gfo/Idh/MocA family oxidoreductase [Planctomycetota bacterium]
MLANEKLDAVNIALPDHWHAIPAIDALKAGCDIHGEKPLTHNLVEGRAICDAVERYGRIWQTGSWQRSTANFHHACEIVRNGRIGKIHTVEVGLGVGFKDYAKNGDQVDPVAVPPGLDYDRWIGPAPWAPYCPARVHKNWRWHLDYGGGRIMDWVGHYVDIAHWGLGFDRTGPVEIEGSGVRPATGLWNAHTEYDVMCKYANGVRMRISNQLKGGTKWIGDEGWVHVTRGRTQASNPDLLREKFGPNDIRLYKSIDHMVNFVECIKSRRETVTPAETAHRAASVGHLSLIAIETGRKLKWDPLKEEFINDEMANRYLSRSMRSPWQL